MDRQLIETIWRRFLDGHTVAETAKHLGLSKKEVADIHRELRPLAKEYESLGERQTVCQSLACVALAEGGHGIGPGPQRGPHNRPVRWFLDAIVGGPVP